MARHKMSLDVNYVSDWGVQDAIRELFQNAIDWGNWTPRIHEDSGEIDIISHNAVLSPSTLLLGHSRKQGDESIGKFGEGYKLAMLVLTRLGYQCMVYTGDGEIWIPKLIKSRTYKTQQLVFDTVKDSDPQNQSVSFYVKGLTQEDFTEIKRRNLHLDLRKAWESTSKGIILDDRPGDIFVGGLWVCNIPEFKYGYNFKPKTMSLDRDRRLVRAFDVSWLTCQMWAETDRHDIVVSLIKEDAPDTKYLDSHIWDTKEALADQAAQAFLTEHGPTAVAVSDQSQLEKAQEEKHEKVVLVKPLERMLITRSSLYVPPPPPMRRKTPREELLDFKNKWGDRMIEMGDDLDALIEKAESWVRV